MVETSWLIGYRTVNLIPGDKEGKMASLLVDHTDILKKLEQVRTIALVGASSRTERPSHRVMAFLLQQGFDVIPVNPGQAGRKIWGQTVAATLAEINHHIDMVDVFRNSEAVPAIVDEVLHLPALPKLLWLQLGVIHEGAACRTVAAGVDVVMNRCPAIELGGYHHG